MRFNEMDPNRKKAMDAALAKVKAGLPKQKPMANTTPAPTPKDPHTDKSTIWKKGFADGKAGRMDPRASDAYGPRTGEYEAGYAAGSKVEEAMTTARQKLVKDFEKVAGYKISDKEAWYQAVNDYYKGKRDTWPDPREFGLKENVESITEEQFDEAAGEKDACYHKVKSRYKVWPSAYASGALVKCRKVGAKNWGNKSKKK